MALNEPCVSEQEVDDIISRNIVELTIKLKMMQIEVTIEDINYDFFSRVEKLYLKSSRIFPNQDLPHSFGVQRGYSGGGIHGKLLRTEISRMNDHQEKASHILDYIENTFWQILKEIDAAYENVNDQPIPSWNSMQI